jgi:hypothetical protein
MTVVAVFDGENGESVYPVTDTWREVGVRISVSLAAKRDLRRGDIIVFIVFLIVSTLPGFLTGSRCIGL